MSGKESKKKKKVSEVLSWKQKQKRAEKDEEAIKKEVEELISWACCLVSSPSPNLTIAIYSQHMTKMMETMNDEQLKEYLLQSVKTAKSAPAKKAKRAVKPRASSGDNSMMAAV